MSRTFSLVLIVLIGVFIWLVTPQPFAYPKGSGRRAACIGNLTQLASAKEQWAIDHYKQVGSQPLWSDVIGPYLKSKPSCPEGGFYVIGQVGNNPRCSHNTGDNPHVLP